MITIRKAPLPQLKRLRPTLALCDRIIASGVALYARDEVKEVLAAAGADPERPPERGLPIGNLTSQWWANHFLSGFDHALKRDFKVPYAQRYMDGTG